MKDYIRNVFKPTAKTESVEDKFIADVEVYCHELEPEASQKEKPSDSEELEDAKMTYNNTKKKGEMSLSNLEKAIVLLQELPEQSVDTVYSFIRFIHSEQANANKNCDGMNGLQILQSFAGTLPKDFDYKRELEEAREGKYDRFN